MKRVETGHPVALKSFRTPVYQAFRALILLIDIDSTVMDHRFLVSYP